MPARLSFWDISLFRFCAWKTAKCYIGAAKLQTPLLPSLLVRINWKLVCTRFKAFWIEWAKKSIFCTFFAGTGGWRNSDLRGLRPRRLQILKITGIHPTSWGHKSLAPPGTYEKGTKKIDFFLLIRFRMLSKICKPIFQLILTNNEGRRGVWSLAVPI